MVAVGYGSAWDGAQQRRLGLRAALRCAVLLLCIVRCTANGACLHCLGVLASS